MGYRYKARVEIACRSLKTKERFDKVAKELKRKKICRTNEDVLNYLLDLYETRNVSFIVASSQGNK